MNTMKKEGKWNRISTLVMPIMFVFFIILSSFSNVVPAYADEISVIINGIYMESDVQPVIVEGRTMVPFRPIAEAMDCEVVYSNDNGKQIIQIKNKIIALALEIGNPIMSVKRRTNMTETETIWLDVAPSIVAGRTMVPVRAIAEVFDADVKWNDASKTVIITSKYDQIPLEVDVNNLLKIKKGYLSGYMDLSGNIIIPAIYDSIVYTGDNYICVDVIGAKVAKYDIQTMQKREQTYTRMYWADGQFLALKNEDGVEKGYTINPQTGGAILRYSEVREFVKGYAAVKDFTTDKYGFIGTDGSLVIACKYLKVDQFVECTQTRKNGQIIYYCNGKEVKFNYSDSHTLPAESEKFKLAKAFLDSSSHCYIDVEGNEFIYDRDADLFSLK